VDLIVEAFANMPDKKLVVVGTGPDMDKIKKLQTANIELLGYQPFAVLKEYMEKARAFVFAAEEDFGIVAVESQACGVPVIAFGMGGSLETVKQNKTGLFFYEQTAEAIIEAITAFEKLHFDHKAIRTHAEQFSKERFKQEITNFVLEKCKYNNQ
jgi:glycosyltransferase involved in cell wall biosynthesis